MVKIRVGQGYDVHRLKEGLPFRLGGVDIPHTHGAEGHSDADVLIHAVCDALLGAAGMRDIGFHFPNTDPKYKGIDSKILLRETVLFIREKGYTIGNVDATVCLERPKISSYIDAMKSVLAEIMGIHMDDVSVKATTEEGMGFTGRGEGVSTSAVVLIYKD